MVYKWHFLALDQAKNSHVSRRSAARRRARGPRSARKRLLVRSRRCDRGTSPPFRVVVKARRRATPRSPRAAAGFEVIESLCGAPPTEPSSAAVGGRPDGFATDDTLAAPASATVGVSWLPERASGRTWPSSATASRCVGVASSTLALAGSTCVATRSRPDVDARHR